MKDQDKTPKQDETVEIYGVRGLKSVSFRKTFKNQAALEKWMEKNGDNVQILGYAYGDHWARQVGAKR